MFEDLPGNNYAEVSHMREIALRLMARQVDLGKENFPRLPFERSPDFDFPLQRAYLPFLELSLMLPAQMIDRKSTRLNSSHLGISYAVFCLKKKKNILTS